MQSKRGEKRIGRMERTQGLVRSGESRGCVFLRSGCEPSVQLAHALGDVVLANG